MFSRKTKILTGFFVLALVGSLPILVNFSKQKTVVSQHAAGTGVFHTEGTKIIDPSGNQFIVKGIDAIYGRFAGGDQNGYGLTNYNNGQRDLDYLKSQGVNLIRLSVSADAATPGNAWNIPNYMTDLDTAINWITSRGLIAELSQGETQDPAVAATFLGQLATKYKGNPLVWIKADNEPFCIINQSHCNDWPYWQQKHQAYIQAIRTAGYTGPIVINCLSWSWDCSKIAQYPLNDNNLIYGAHMYSNGATDFQTSSNTGPNAANTGWANLSGQYAMIVDEVGSFSTSLTSGSQLNWNVGFLDFATNWVQTRGGDGVIAFNFYWSDQNNMSNGSGKWNDWGNVYYTHYLSKISSSTLTPPAVTNGYVSPTVFCLGSCNSPVTPTALPTQTTTTGNPTPTQSMSITPITPGVTQQPCPQTQSVTSAKSKSKSQKKGSNGGNAGLLSALLRFFELLIDLLIKLLGGQSKLPSTPLPCPSPTMISPTIQQ